MMRANNLFSAKLLVMPSPFALNKTGRFFPPAFTLPLRSKDGVLPRDVKKQNASSRKWSLHVMPVYSIKSPLFAASRKVLPSTLMKRKEERKRKRSEEKKKKKGKEEEKKKKRKKSKRGKEEDVSQKGKKSTPVNIETPHLNNKYIRTLGVFFGSNFC